MEVHDLESNLLKRLSLQRFEHVLRVRNTAVILAEKHAISAEDAEIAALFHDIAKNEAKQLLEKTLMKKNVDKRYLSFHHELWHAPVGAIIAHDEFGVKNEDILNAIRFHTTGRASMSPLEKLIYVADMIEPGREFPNVEKLRELALGNLDVAMGACIYQSVQFLVSKKAQVFPDSIDCYNEHVIMKGIVNE